MATAIHSFLSVFDYRNRINCQTFNKNHNQAFFSEINAGLEISILQIISFVVVTFMN